MKAKKNLFIYLFIALFTLSYATIVKADAPAFYFIVTSDIESSLVSGYNPYMSLGSENHVIKANRGDTIPVKIIIDNWDNQCDNNNANGYCTFKLENGKIALRYDNGGLTIEHADMSIDSTYSGVSISYSSGGTSPFINRFGSGSFAMGYRVTGNVTVPYGISTFATFNFHVPNNAPDGVYAIALLNDLGCLTNKYGLSYYDNTDPFCMKEMQHIIYVQVGNTVTNQTHTVSKDDVKNSTYIIGKSMFTKTGSSSYNGQLTTNHIMKAAMTSSSDNINDMIIYYKNARGNWVNAITNQSITPPNSFEISYQDLEVFNGIIHTPVLSCGVLGYESDSSNLGYGYYNYDCNVNIEDYNIGTSQSPKFSNPYYKIYEKVGNSYQLYNMNSSVFVNESRTLFDIDEVVGITIEAGTSKTFVAQACLSADECGDYSEEITLDWTAISAPTISFGKWPAFGVVDEPIVISPAKYLLNVDSNSIQHILFDDTELYKKNGNTYENLGSDYNKNTIRSIGEYLEFGQVNTFVAKVYITNSSGQKIYSGYSNELVVDLTNPTYTFGKTSSGVNTSIVTVYVNKYPANFSSITINNVEYTKSCEACSLELNNSILEGVTNATVTFGENDTFPATYIELNPPMYVYNGVYTQGNSVLKLYTVEKIEEGAGVNAYMLLENGSHSASYSTVISNHESNSLTFTFFSDEYTVTFSGNDVTLTTNNSDYPNGVYTRQGEYSTADFYEEYFGYDASVLANSNYLYETSAESNLGNFREMVIYQISATEVMAQFNFGNAFNSGSLSVQLEIQNDGSLLYTGDSSSMTITPIIEGSTTTFRVATVNYDQEGLDADYVVQGSRLELAYLISLIV